MKKGKGETALITWDCGSTLYDSVELASLAHLIERHMMALPALDRSNASRSEGGGTTVKIMKDFHSVGTSIRYVDQKKMMIKRGRKEKQKPNIIKSALCRLFSSIRFLKK